MTRVITWADFLYLLLQFYHLLRVPVEKFKSYLFAVGIINLGKQRSYTNLAFNCKWV